MLTSTFAASAPPVHATKPNPAWFETSLGNVSYVHERRWLPDRTEQRPMFATPLVAGGDRFVAVEGDWDAIRAAAATYDRPVGLMQAHEGAYFLTGLGQTSAFDAAPVDFTGGATQPPAKVLVGRTSTIQALQAILLPGGAWFDLRGSHLPPKLPDWTLP